MLLDPLSGLYETCRCREVSGIKRRATLSSTAAIEPAPFSAQDVNHRVPDGAVAARQELAELLRRQLQHHVKELSVGPEAIVEQSFQILDRHLTLAFSRCSAPDHRLSAQRFSSPSRRSQ